MPNSKNVLIALHFLRICPSTIGSFVARLSDTDVELRDVGLVDVEAIEVTTAVFAPPDDAPNALRMHRGYQHSWFIAAAMGNCEFE